MLRVRGLPTRGCPGRRGKPFALGQKDDRDARWQHYFESPPTKIGFGTLYYEARQIRPFFVPPFDPLPDEDGGDGNSTGGDLPFETKPRPRILTMRELDLLPPPEWLVEGLIPEKSLVVARWFPPKAGMTFVVLLVLSRTSPRWAARFSMTVKQGAVVYIAGCTAASRSACAPCEPLTASVRVDALLFAIPRAAHFRARRRY